MKPFRSGEKSSNGMNKCAGLPWLNSNGELVKQIVLSWRLTIVLSFTTRVNTLIDFTFDSLL